MPAERIVVGMSGGVDSSVAAALLVEQGVEVIGVTLRVWPWREPEGATRRFGCCCSPDDRRGRARGSRGASAFRTTCSTSSREFDRTVIEPFARAYAEARTPVPCVACNRDVKFGSLLGARAPGTPLAVATGHYARISAARRPVARFLLARPRPAQGSVRFPLAADAGAARAPRDFRWASSPRTRCASRRAPLGLVTADKPESQEICFIPDEDYRGFLRQRDAGHVPRGIDRRRRGPVLGRHEGVAGFTVGQRRGLGLAAGRALYVVDLDPAADRVTVGEAAADLERDRLVAGRVNFIAGTPPAGPQRVLAKIRHSHEPAAATLRMLPEGQAEVVFDQPQRAIAPGQSCVWYQGEVVLGGGVIERR